MNVTTAKRILVSGVLLAGLAAPQAPAQERDPYAELREQMVREQIAARGIGDERLLAAMRAVPRHELMPDDVRRHAYADYPVPIGEMQTISQPYIVAYMTEQLELAGDERVLEIGTGSGYQAAVLAELAAEVYTIEIVEPLAKRAAADLKKLGYENIHTRYGDGYRGWPEEAPFDAIIVTAAPGRVPEPLVEQLAVGGRMIVPVGAARQELILITRDEEGVHRQRLIGVRFVPMTGEVLEED
ncbi:MAG: protein-L-isoaspartate(D-aspartate) O-methyltransferase [Acidobacteria bacterium]|nr:protein-L-isoaspartate(D-aspartate) O-methyltransferase [Acidobacteriota bacterium]NIM60430.1 protein-L-isoaspartate(D-aspartate) O-methyltransferase [Acidobacteriota bacterium]NIO58605.1 protein-L-isoaspartate(D-aspartate) O-methyltransferase [Acidobacteriota bacterium]NIQ29657.1 protein-L-isoaspartate(D-aspartate) O-methyltransferase [Acidobacteriota bacterium]NIQ84374.1 protein-L-isoaspartate(D-aspartate) O-methyltransferase [Acidobacteriota bacterium]